MNVIASYNIGDGGSCLHSLPEAHLCSHEVQYDGESLAAVLLLPRLECWQEDAARRGTCHAEQSSYLFCPGTAVSPGTIYGCTAKMAADALP